MIRGGVYCASCGSELPPGTGACPSCGAARPPAAVVQTSTLAIVAFVFGLLGITGPLPVIGPIIAIILAGRAEREIRESGGALTGEAWARIGRILGIVGLVIAALFLVAFGALFAVAFLFGSETRIIDIQEMQVPAVPGGRLPWR